MSGGHFERGVRALEDDDPGRALREFQLEAEANGETGAVLDNMALAACRLGEESRSLELRRRALALDPENPLILYNMASTHLDSDEPHEAERCLMAALHARPKWDDALFNLGRALYDQGRWLEALEQYHKVSSACVDDALMFAIGSCFSELMDHAEAASAFRAATELDSTSQEAWYMLGLTLAELGQHADALVAMRVAHELDPSDHEAAIEVGRFLVELDELESAKAHLLRIVERWPDVGRGWLWLAKSAVGLGDSAMREMARDKATRLNPDLSEYLPDT